MSLLADPTERLRRARTSLEGLSVGDGFGDQFFRVRDSLIPYFTHQRLPFKTWPFTDDTNMALSIYEVLRQHQQIDQDVLARSFAEHYHQNRGYGPAMHRVMRRINEGEHWRIVANDLFEGQGSYGNGGAMRVAPLGAYFADNLDQVVAQARLSAEITHAHEEGIAGAIAVAVAAAFAASFQGRTPPPPSYILNLIHYRVPDSIVREKIRHASLLAPGSSVYLAVSALGNGDEISAQDTVPFCLWCACEHLRNYEQALWVTASGLGDIDTTCAIVGGIVAAYTGIEGIPVEWLAAREVLPDWAFSEEV